MTSILAVALDTELATRISTIPGHRLVSIDRDNFTRAVEDVTFFPDLILVGDGLTSEQGIRYAQRVLTEYPTMTIMLVAEPTRDLVHEATKVGIRGVINDSISDHDLLGLIDRAGRHAHPDAGLGDGDHQVIVVASPKGGVGKTTMAVSVAALLAEDAPGEVVLLDLDLQFGDVSSVVDLQPEFTVADALSSGASDSMLLRTLLVPHPANFYVLCGADHPAAAGPVSGDQVRKLVSQFANDFRYVVIDTSAGIQEETLASMEEATDVVFIATLDVATLRNVRKEVDVLAELGLLPGRRHLLVNRADRLSGLTSHDVENIVGLPVDTTVPAAPNVPLAANHGVLAVQAKKRNKVRAPLRQFTQNVTNRTRRPGRHR